MSEIATVQYRSLSRTRLVVFLPSIPDDMLRALGWTPDQPIRIELEGKSLRLTQVESDGLHRVHNGQWVRS